MVGASFGALLGNVTAAQSAQDSYGYVYTDSNAPAPSVGFQWVDISTTGTYVGASGDDDWAGPFPIGFDFNFYDNRYSAFNVTTNGYIMFSPGTYDYGNDYIPYTSTPNNIVAAYWDDLYADSGEIVYETVGAYPDRQLVVEFMNVTRLGSSYLMTFEIVLNETGGDMWVNYLTMNGMTGNSATEGIENSDGTIGIQYGYNDVVLSDGLSIRYSLPEVVIAPSQTGRGAPGTIISYLVVATNRQQISDSLAITYTSVEGWPVGLYDDAMNPLTDTDGDGLVDTGILGSMDSRNLTITVEIPASPAATQEYTIVNASSYANPLLLFGCTLTTEVLPGWFAPPHSEYGDDTDSDGLYNYLVFDISVEIFTPGWYAVEGYLYTAMENYISYDWVQTYLTAGSHTMELRFYGWPINQLAIDGPYHVHLTLYDPSWNDIGQGIWTTASYTYAEFMEVPGAYAPPFSDNGVDTDSDGLYDLMQVNVSIDVNYAGRYVVSAYLRAPDWTNLAYEVSDSTLSAGTNVIQFFFDAWDVSEAMTSGQFHVQLGLQAEVDGVLNWLGNYWYDTSDYDLLTFERPGAVFIAPFNDWTVDLDSDFLYDFLIVEIGVNVTVEGDYLVTGELEDWWGDTFLTATNLTHLAVGDHLVQLSFPGWPIRYTGDNGPYDIYLTIMNSSLLLDEWNDNTGGYWWNDFEDAPGWFELPYSDMGVDTDGNLLYDYLVVTVGVNVTEAGTYRIDATLYDDWWNNVESISNVTLLTAGLNSVELRFSGWLINSNANDGVFDVDLNLFDSGNRLMDSDSYSTVAYLYADFEGLPGQFGWPHEWSPANDDGDAAFERLLVNVTIDVYNADRFLVQGNLYDSGWQWIAEASAWADLDAGTQSVQLSFPGWMINEYGTNGIYHVEMQLWDANRYYLDWDTLATTTLDPVDFDTTVPSINSEWAVTAPSVDGMAGAGEWDSAAVIDLATSVPINGIEGEIRIMNDANSLYILIDAHGDLTPDEDDYASIAFDTDNDNLETDLHEDQFVLRGVSWARQVHYVFDSGGWVQDCEPFAHDGLFGGMGFGSSPTEARDHRIYEFAIPLSLLGATQGDILGFIGRSQFFYGLYDSFESTRSDWPMSFAWQPELPMYADLVLASNLADPPPVTTAIIAGTAGSGGWYKSATTVTLSANGGDGGVAYTEYRLAGGSWMTYTTPFAVSGDGTHTYEFRSVDNAAQTEATKTVAIKIDTVAPVSASEVSGATVWFNSTDATSGIGSIMYRVDSGIWTVYGTSLTMTEAGTYVIDFYSVDSAGNQEATKSVTVVVEEEDIPEDEPSSSNLLIYIGIGAVAAIVAILLVLMLLMKRRKGQQPAAVTPQSPYPTMPLEPPPPT